MYQHTINVSVHINIDYRISNIQNVILWQRLSWQSQFPLLNHMWSFMKLWCDGFFKSSFSKYYGIDYEILLSGHAHALWGGVRGEALLESELNNYKWPDLLIIILH